MAKFKTGQEVRLKLNRARETDFLADLQNCFADRDISGRAYDTLVNAIEGRKVWIVWRVERDDEEFESYELKVRDGKTRAPFMVNEDDLEGVA